MADTFSFHDGSLPIRSWDGGRLNTKAHGPGTLIDAIGGTFQCTLNQGVISGYCWYTNTVGNKAALAYNTQGMGHGTQIRFFTSGGILLQVYINGNHQTGSPVQGMICIQYI